MSVWKFQLLTNVPNVVAHGYRMDSIGSAVDQEVNDALPYRFRFHKISKIVLVLGPAQQELYSEALGVAEKVVPSFSLSDYVQAADSRKRDMLREVISREFAWFEQNFDDADFIGKTRAKLSWSP